MNSNNYYVTPLFIIILCAVSKLQTKQENV